MKKLRVLLAFAIAGVMCTGCFSKEISTVTQTADLFADNNITEDDEINTGRCQDIFTEALSAAIKEENITIGMNFTSSYGEDKLMNDITLKLDYAEDQKASLKILTNNSGEESTEYGYYIHGFYYSDDGTEKTKTEKDFGKFLYENDGYSMDIESSIVSKLACVENDGIKTYYMSYDPVGYENQLITNMEAAGDPLEQDESLVINYANMIFQVDENNIMKSYSFTTSTQHKNGEDTNDYIYDITVTFSDIGKTQVDVPEDLGAYSSVESSDEATTAE